MNPTLLAVLAEDHHAQLIRDADIWRRANQAENPRPRRRTARRTARQVVTTALGHLRTASTLRPDSRHADLCCA